MSTGASIIVCGQRFDVGRRVVTFEDDPAFSAYTERCVTLASVLPVHPAQGLGKLAARYRRRRLLVEERSLTRLRHVVRQFVVHHDGVGSSRDCFRVLHDERGLSVHFLIDNNGDIYQTLDLADCGFHAAGVNEISIGAELSNRGNALRFPDFYDRTTGRDKVTCTINGHQFLCYGYTLAQLESMVALGRALARIFPDLPQTYPQDASGEPLWSTLAGDPRRFAGYLGHFHVSDRKWDPGPWDFKKLIHAIRRRLFFPLAPGRPSSEVTDSATGEAMAHDLYDNNEREGEGGYFPIGPLGEMRLWHTGAHLRDDRGAPVVAPFAGKLVAARFRSEDDWPPVGSPNFVLIRHELSFGGETVRFFTLLVHLDVEPSADGSPAWMKAAANTRWERDLRAGDVALLEQPVAAGEVVGRVGEAGRPGNWLGQIHLEIFAADEIGETIEPGFWRPVDGSRGGRFCEVPSIVDPIDADRNRTLDPGEVVRFFRRDPRRAQFHTLAVRHLSEWSEGNDWLATLGKSRTLAKLSRAAKQRLFREQIEPLLWWTDELGAIGLPDDKIVWSYHPVTFIEWLAGRLRSRAEAAQGVRPRSSFGGTSPPPDIQDDGTATEGFVDEEDLLFGEGAKHLDLEQLSNGYPDD